jgi:hypothetical protein
VIFLLSGANPTLICIGYYASVLHQIKIIFILKTRHAIIAGVVGLTPGVNVDALTKLGLLRIRVCGNNFVDCSKTFELALTA